MGQAREAMDRLTEAMTTTRSAGAIAECFAPDAVASTPDGEFRGRDAIADYMAGFAVAVPDSEFDHEHRYEAGDTAVDEGWLHGTNTGPLTMPDGTTLAPTGRPIRIHGCDIATAEDGRIVDYRLYFDQLAFLEQLGLAPAAG
ncbi:ester cyclase [Yinghuangia soli]|uniref:Ester cyclase n=1 Tax=Yinghuangia soli TaxID=2908204 RepID=A0AA41Q3C7_9ACTN|nr:nuclear transport factor 2 family protein [Yinghuangia soli]MCF2530793.1 ester cyclase [Yinghuangia soli]